MALFGFLKKRASHTSYSSKGQNNKKEFTNSGNGKTLKTRPESNSPDTSVKRKSLLYILTDPIANRTSTTSSSTEGNFPNVEATRAPPVLSDSYGRPRNFSMSSRTSESEQKGAKALSNVLHSRSASTISSNRVPFMNSGDEADTGMVSVPQSLVPAVTIIHAQQARCYFEATVDVPVNDHESPNKPLSAIAWRPAFIRLIGTDLAIMERKSNTKRKETTASDTSYDRKQKPSSLLINISDAELEFIKSGATYDLKLNITNEKCYYIRCENEQDMNYLIAGLFLSQFEYKQLQESFTGALLSSTAVHFSDVRTLLDPKNLHAHGEWCILRFPFINDKWIRCYVIVRPQSRTIKKKHKCGKIEVYTSRTISKKNLLAIMTNGHSAYSLYPENPKYIDSNALIRTWADCYINRQLIQKIIQEDDDSSINENGSTFGYTNTKHLKIIHRRTRTSSFSSLRPSARRLSRARRSNTHRRADSTVSVMSSHSEAGYAQAPERMKKLDLVQTKLCYMIPETHGAVQPSETMLRLLIPIMNTFHLYGRPEKFRSNRDDKHSLLFGFPQLPHTQYMDMQTAFDLVSLNMTNANQQHWTSYEWIEVFKELVHLKMSKGWDGTGSIVDVYRDGLLYRKENHSSSSTVYTDYDPEEDFASNSNNSATGNSSNNRNSSTTESTTPFSVEESIKGKDIPIETSIPEPIPRSNETAVH